MSKHHHHGQGGPATEGGQVEALPDPNINEAGSVNCDRGVLPALKSARNVACNARQKVVAGAKATDKAVQEHPYKALGIAVGLGVLLGMFLVSRKSRKTVN